MEMTDRKHGYKSKSYCSLRISISSGKQIQELPFIFSSRKTITKSHRYQLHACEHHQVNQTNFIYAIQVGTLPNTNLIPTTSLKSCSRARTMYLWKSKSGRFGQCRWEGGNGQYPCQFTRKTRTLMIVQKSLNSTSQYLTRTKADLST